MRRCAAGVTLRPSGHPAAETGRREDAARQSPLYAFHPSPARKSQAAHAPPPSAGAARAPPPPPRAARPACEICCRMGKSCLRRGRSSAILRICCTGACAGRPASSGEVSELAEGARLEIVYAPKAYPGFESPPLRH